MNSSLKTLLILGNQLVPIQRLQEGLPEGVRITRSTWPKIWSFVVITATTNKNWC